MNIEIYKCLENIEALSAPELHQMNQKYRAQLAHSEWYLSVTLLASDRGRLYRQLEKKYPDTISYAENELNLSREKTLELLSTARAFERLPALSKAFGEGKLSWGKVRELKRVATPETERVWCEYALGHTLAAIPNKNLRIAFARAGNRCECCGRSGCQLDGHHRVAVSDGGGDEPENLLVLCKFCHALMHEDDFEQRWDWLRARARALKGTSTGKSPPSTSRFASSATNASMAPDGLHPVRRSLGVPRGDARRIQRACPTNTARRPDQ